jgi:glutamyl-Q tRNA(Asp) synthetase
MVSSSGSPELGSSKPAILSASKYRGRFAPSPTGDLHFGSLVAAVASYLAARQAGGAWLVRIEDLDRPREIPGSAKSIVDTLNAFGFEWTGSIVRQSDRIEAYEAALDTLRASGQVYPCSCSRKDIAAAGVDGEEARYPGWCRTAPLQSDAPCAIRFRVDRGVVSFFDEIQGSNVIDVAAETGDFVLKRRDGLFAYQLAVVVDDAEQGVTHVVRGADLLSSTPRQLLLQQSLGLPSPAYAHVPLATDHLGVKLSKSTGAGAVDTTKPTEELWRTLLFLRQKPPLELLSSPLRILWEWAVHHWTTTPLRGLRQAAVEAAPVDAAG